MKLVAFTLDELDAYLSSDDVPGNSMQLSDLDGFSIALAAGSTQGSTPPSPPGTLPQPPSSPERPAQVKDPPSPVLLPPLKSPPPIRSSQ